MAGTSRGNMEQQTEWHRDSPYKHVLDVGVGEHDGRFGKFIEIWRGDV